MPREFPEVNKYELTYALKQAGLIYEDEETGELHVSATDLTKRIENALTELNKFYKPRTGPNMIEWASRDYGYREDDLESVELNKKSLGAFVYHVLRLGGNVKDFFVMDRRVKGSYVDVSLELPEGTEDEFMKTSGFQLRKPSSFTPA